MLPSIDSLMRLVSGACYLAGFIMIYVSVQKFKSIADYRAMSRSQEKMLQPVAYAVGGIVLIFLPSAISVARSTFFGSGVAIGYTGVMDQLKAKYGDATFVMLRLLELAGLIWFVVGIYLLAQASAPGVQQSKKGIVLLLAGIVALNINYTISLVDGIMSWITS